MVELQMLKISVDKEEIDIALKHQGSRLVNLSQINT